MIKTSNFFLIHNYNTVPDDLLKYCNNYVIYDASDDSSIMHTLDEKSYNVIHIPNTGHNITTYFSYFADHLEKGDLPCVIECLKGNIIGRHVSKEYFDAVYQNTFFTYLYEERSMRDRYSKATPEVIAAHNGKDPSEGCIASLLSQSRFIEVNSSWYMHENTHPSKYFTDFDDLLRFIYKDPVIPKYVEFAPGGCYILRKEQVELHSASFYRNLNKIQNYTITPGFPAEAYIIERLLPIIFNERCEVNPWMNDDESFDMCLAEQAKRLTEKKEALSNRTFFQKVKDHLKNSL